MKNKTGKSMMDEEGHTIRPGEVYYEDGVMHKKRHCKDCYEELSDHSGSHLREDVEDDILSVGSMVVGATLGMDDDTSDIMSDDSSSGFGSDSDSDDSFDGGDGGGGGDSGDC